jgi:hypothetical protein
MRLVMTLLVRDEVDIVRQNIEFHLAQGVDFVVATDNGSRDGTRELLESFVGRGVLELIDEEGDDYAQHRWVSRMAARARDAHGADWILNNDADEFWLAASGDLKAGLAAAGAAMLACSRRHMLYAHDRPPAPGSFLQITHRVKAAHPIPALADWMTDPLPVPYFYLALPSKVLCRARGLLGVHQGNHGASYQESTVEESAAISIYHYPVRGFDQFVRKIDRGGASYARNASLPPTMGWHWRRWYRMISEGHPERAYAEALPDGERLDRDLHAGRVVVDSSLLQRLCSSQ